MRWEPLFVGSAAEPYRSFIEKVVDGFADRDREVTGNPTLWLGSAGEALALHHLGRFLGRDVGEPVSTLIEHAVTQLNDGVSGDGLFLGPVGVGLVLTWLEEDLPFECSDAIATIDDLVAARLEARSEGTYELFAGRAGDAFYALERASEPRLRAALSTFLGWLEARAVHGPSGAHWLTRPDPVFSAKYGLPADRPFIVLGTAHGLPGLSLVLAGMARAGIEASRAGFLLEEVWRFIRQSTAATGRFRFPVGLCDGQPFGLDQFSWCKGDPGVLAAAITLNDTCASELASLVDSAAQVSLLLADDGERGLCCGDAGRGLIFQYLARGTGLPSARRAAEEAFRRARTLGPAAGGIGLCSGQVGVALAFASALSSEPPRWRSLMGLAGSSLQGSLT
jgi:hypothetical protein